MPWKRGKFRDQIAATSSKRVKVSNLHASRARGNPPSVKIREAISIIGQSRANEIAEEEITLAGWRRFGKHILGTDGKPVKDYEVVLLSERKIQPRVIAEAEGRRGNPKEIGPWPTLKEAKRQWYDSSPGRNDRARYEKRLDGWWIIEGREWNTGMRQPREPRGERTRNVGLTEGIVLGLGSAIGGAVGSALAEPIVNRFKRSLKGYMRNNPSTLQAAEEMSEAFHGRPVGEVTTIEDVYKYNENLAGLGKLVELQIACMGGNMAQPVHFDYKSYPETTVWLAAGNFVEEDGKTVAKQLYIIGGDQELPYKRLLELCNYDADLDKQYIDMGPIHELTYFADKHHLEGPKWQKKGGQYFHKLGKESGILPTLVYDTLNKQMLLVGGNYKVEDVGIVD